MNTQKLNKIHNPNTVRATSQLEPHQTLIAKTITTESVELETMHDNSILWNTILRQKVGYLKTLIALKLDDTTELLVFDEIAIAGKILEVQRTCVKNTEAYNQIITANLLHFLQDLLEIILCQEESSVHNTKELLLCKQHTFSQPLQSRKCLPTVPLLDTDMNMVLRGPDLVSLF